jgi:AcrR family transcriptional regulator
MAKGEAVRDAILTAAEPLLAADPAARVDAIAGAAGISRATFYRHFRSRRELLEALDMQPDPDAHRRILDAAIELVGRDGLRGMSMDELAARASVSRASVYRLFPGKEALFDALLDEYSPFDELARVVERLADRPPSEVLPAVGRSAATLIGPRIGILRSLFFEVTTQTPEALGGADPRIRRLLLKLGQYLAAHMAAGELRPMPPMLAAQVVVGPIFFHLVTRAEMEHLAVLDVPVETVIDELVAAALRALAPVVPPAA